MQITARLDESAVKVLLAQLLPLTLIIDDDGDDRWLRIDPARGVDIVAGEGLRVHVTGQLHWKAAGVPVLMTIKSAQLLLRPVLVEDDGGRRLVFRPSVESMDLKHVPGFVDSGITNRINKRLEARGDGLAWHFARALNIHLPLGKDLTELDSFDLTPGAATVEVLADAIVFTLELTMGFARVQVEPPTG